MSCAMRCRSRRRAWDAIISRSRSNWALCSCSARRSARRWARLRLARPGTTVVARNASVVKSSVCSTDRSKDAWWTDSAAYRTYEAVNSASARLGASILAPADQLTTISTTPKAPRTPATAPVRTSTVAGNARRSTQSTTAATAAAAIRAAPWSIRLSAASGARTRARAVSPRIRRRGHMPGAPRCLRTSRAFIGALLRGYPRLQAGEETKHPRGGAKASSLSGWTGGHRAIPGFGHKLLW